MSHKSGSFTLDIKLSTANAMLPTDCGHAANKVKNQEKYFVIKAHDFIQNNIHCAALLGGARQGQKKERKDVND